MHSSDQNILSLLCEPVNQYRFHIFPLKIENPSSFMYYVENPFLHALDYYLTRKLCK